MIEFFVFVCLSDEFRSKVACENDSIQLMCNPYSRIAIYGASYGRTEYESLQCAQPHGVKEESKLMGLIEAQLELLIMFGGWEIILPQCLMYGVSF